MKIHKNLHVSQDSNYMQVQRNVRGILMLDLQKEMSCVIL